MTDLPFKTVDQSSPSHAVHVFIPYIYKIDFNSILGLKCLLKILAMTKEFANFLCTLFNIKNQKDFKITFEWFKQLGLYIRFFSFKFFANKACQK